MASFVWSSNCKDLNENKEMQSFDQLSLIPGMDNYDMKSTNFLDEHQSYGQMDIQLPLWQEEGELLEHRNILFHFNVEGTEDNLHLSKRRMIVCPLSGRLRYWDTECDQVFNQGTICERGDSCPHIHNLEEMMYHPARYKIRMCMGTSCRGTQCPDAHGEHELRHEGASRYSYYGMYSMESWNTEKGLCNVTGLQEDSSTTLSVITGEGSSTGYGRFSMTTGLQEDSSTTPSVINAEGTVSFGHFSMTGLQEDSTNTSSTMNTDGTNTGFLCDSFKDSHGRSIPENNLTGSFYPRPIRKMPENTITTESSTTLESSTECCWGINTVGTCEETEWEDSYGEHIPTDDEWTEKDTCDASTHFISTNTVGSTVGSGSMNNLMFNMHSHHSDPSYFSNSMDERYHDTNSSDHHQMYNWDSPRTFSFKKVYSSNDTWTQYHDSTISHETGPYISRKINTIPCTLIRNRKGYAIDQFDLNRRVLDNNTNNSNLDIELITAKNVTFHLLHDLTVTVSSNTFIKKFPADEKFHHIPNKQRYCSSFPYSHFCERGDNCMFAHSFEDVRYSVEIEEDNNKITLTDDFLIYKFKTAWCPIGVKHDWQSCVYAHNYHDARRNPAIGYGPKPCPMWSRREVSTTYNNRCPNGVRCPFAHGAKEQLYHPIHLKTRYCQDLIKDDDIPLCPRGKLCAFWHTPLDRKYLRDGDEFDFDYTQPISDSLLSLLQPDFMTPATFESGVENTTSWILPNQLMEWDESSRIHHWADCIDHDEEIFDKILQHDNKNNYNYNFTPSDSIDDKKSNDDVEEKSIEDDDYLEWLMEEYQYKNTFIHFHEYPDTPITATNAHVPVTLRKLVRCNSF